MTQLGLLSWSPPHPAPSASEQSREIARVEGRIAETVIAFCRERIGQEFRLAELTAYVACRIEVAPDSPRRILGQLRRTGQVDVEVVNRSASLWRVRAAGVVGAIAP